MASAYPTGGNAELEAFLARHKGEINPDFGRSEAIRLGVVEVVGEKRAGVLGKLKEYLDLKARARPAEAAEAAVRAAVSEATGGIVIQEFGISPDGVIQALHGEMNGFTGTCRRDAMEVELRRDDIVEAFAGISVGKFTANKLAIWGALRALFTARAKSEAATAQARPVFLAFLKTLK
jgi:hypothetical protein